MGAVFEFKVSLRAHHPLVDDGLTDNSIRISQPPNTNQIQTSSEVIKFTKNVLDECLTDRYLIVTQPGINAADLTQNDCLMPHVCKTVEASRVKGKYTVAEVIGDVTEAKFDEYIKLACRKKGKTAHVKSVQLGSLSPAARAQDLASNGTSVLKEDEATHVWILTDGVADVSLTAELEAVTAADSYTVLLYATPREPLYESDFIEPVHMGMKRDAGSAPLRQQTNETEFNKLPLFEKYQFFTPGIFMGLVVAIVLLSILGAGIRGLASLEVSYGAFDKEMGPAAQKKQQ
ncbi:ER protein BIG1 [Metarhizium robertsii ARSEF 23]|uniref:Protein BIG1 n=1 Tax=Metarhizium robertsii (strain ARSEF 23 / ATCC MYA-3075) TaxID=655844 RepID=E9F3R1_METRA|nr:ER protein BIG1 [Metarhizium robertsii ARSEF 23]EFY97597.1 ER protein BIG1 [Metarhizium robertsii ARSEF 23]